MYVCTDTHLIFVFSRCYNPFTRNADLHSTSVVHTHTYVHRFRLRLVRPLSHTIHDSYRHHHSPLQLPPLLCRLISICLSFSAFSVWLHFADGLKIENCLYHYLCSAVMKSRSQQTLHYMHFLLLSCSFFG